MIQVHPFSVDEEISSLNKSRKVDIELVRSKVIQILGQSVSDSPERNFIPVQPALRTQNGRICRVQAAQKALSVNLALEETSLL